MVHILDKLKAPKRAKKNIQPVITKEVTERSRDMKEIQYASSFDAITIGIIMEIPITGVANIKFQEEVEGCPKCDLWKKVYGHYYVNEKKAPREAFCRFCGTACVITERNSESESGPTPDIRQDLEDFGLEYVPFGEDFDFEDSCWFIPIKEYDTFGHRGDWRGGALRQYNPAKIVKDLKEAKTKYASFVKKHKGKIYFGSISVSVDW